MTDINSKKIKYNDFLNIESIKLMYREIFLMIVFLCGIFYMAHAVLNSSVNVVRVYGLSVSLHYIFPLVLAVVCFSFLFYKFILIYKNVVTDIYIENNILTFVKLGFGVGVSNIFIDELVDEKKWSYLNGFNRNYVHLIHIKDSSGQLYYLPFEKEKKEELLLLLSKYEK